MPDMLLLTTGGVDGGLSATAIPVKLSFCTEKEEYNIFKNVHSFGTGL